MLATIARQTTRLLALFLWLALFAAGHAHAQASCNGAQPQSATTSATSGTFRIYAYNVNGYTTSMRFPTWGDPGGQDDLVWYPGVNAGGGTWYADINLGNHKAGNPEYGAFQTHVYAYNADGSQSLCAATSWSRVAPPPPGPATCSSVSMPVSSTTATSGNFRIYANGVSGDATSVLFPTWGDSGGQDDLVWYPGSNAGGGTWYVDVNLANHKAGNPEYGAFQTHVYLYNAQGSSWCGATTWSRNLPPPPACGSAGPSQSTTTATSGSFRVFAYGASSSTTNMLFPTWGDPGGQDDLVWYQGYSLGNGTWYADVNLGNHKAANPEYGTFNTHVYAFSANASAGCAGFTWTRAQGGLVNGSFETPAIADWQYDPSAPGIGWTFGSGGGGMQRNGSGFGAAAAPDGVQTAFLQSQGSMSQSVYLDAGSYTLSLRAARRASDGSLGQPVRVRVDGQQVGGLIAPPLASFTEHRISFSVAQAAVHAIRLEGTVPDGSTTFVDRVAVTAGTTPYAQPAQYLVIHPFDQNFLTPADPINDTGRYAADMANQLGRGTEQRRLAFATHIYTFNEDDSVATSKLDTAFAQAEALDLPLFIHVDNEWFAQKRPDLWNWFDPGMAGYDPANRDNVEWSDWNTPTQAFWFNWGRPFRLPPRLCFESPRIKAIVAARGQLIAGKIAAWKSRLASLNKSYLFIGVDAGWETGIFNLSIAPWKNDPYHPETNPTPPPPAEMVNTGFCVLSKRGFSAANPPANVEAELQNAVRDYAAFEAKPYFDAGVTAYTHILANTSAISQQRSPLWTAVNNYSSPGFSVDTGELQWSNIQATVGPRPWAVTETPPAGAPGFSLTSLMQQPNLKFAVVYGWSANVKPNNPNGGPNNMAPVRDALYSGGGAVIPAP